MKTLAAWLMLVGLPMLMQAQAPCVQEYKGEVVLYTSKGLGKVPIVIDGNQGPLTDDNGVFRYRLSKCPGMTVHIKLGGNNWDIVNHTEIYTYTLRQLADPADFQFKLLVAQAQEIEKARRSYYAELAGVAVDKGLTLLKDEIEKLKVLERQQLQEQRLITNQSKLTVTDSQQQRKIGELEKRLDQQQKDYQRVLDSLVREPAMLMGKMGALQKLLEKQRQENQQLLDSLTKEPGQQQGRIQELEKILRQQRQENQQLLNKLALQDSTRQTDKTGELLKIVDRQKQENKRLLDSLATKELAWQTSKGSNLTDNSNEKK